MKLLAHTLTALTLVSMPFEQTLAKGYCTIAVSSWSQVDITKLPITGTYPLESAGTGANPFGPPFKLYKFGDGGCLVGDVSQQSNILDYNAMSYYTAAPSAHNATCCLSNLRLANY